jgi:hypothetical protein
MAVKTLDNIVHNTGGSAGRSYPQQPISGPENPGPPISMRKALAKKSYPSKGTNSPGSVK